VGQPAGQQLAVQAGHARMERQQCCTSGQAKKIAKLCSLHCNNARRFSRLSRFAPCDAALIFSWQRQNMTEISHKINCALIWVSCPPAVSIRWISRHGSQCADSARRLYHSAYVKFTAVVSIPTLYTPASKQGFAAVQSCVFSVSFLYVSICSLLDNVLMAHAFACTVAYMMLSFISRPQICFGKKLYV
jgi:hypothetical protein